MVVIAALTSSEQAEILAQSLSARVWTQVRLSLPQNGSAFEYFSLKFTCPSTTDCVGAGTYENSPTGSSPNEQALLETMSG